MWIKQNSYVIKTYGGKLPFYWDAWSQKGKNEISEQEKKCEAHFEELKSGDSCEVKKRT